jgi:hypothetical protein
MEIGINLLKILFFLVTSYLCWKMYKYSKKMDEKLEEIESLKAEILNSETAFEHFEEESDFFLVEEGVWCWIKNGEAVTTKDFHLSRGGAIEDYERYVEGRELH